MSEFYVGQRVVCVDDRPLRGCRFSTVPKLGVKYTIRDLRAEFGVQVVEIVNTPRLYREGFMEAWYNPRRFRPIEEKSHDISIFRAIAKGVTDGRPIIDDPQHIEIPEDIFAGGGPILSGSIIPPRFAPGRGGKLRGLYSQPANNAFDQRVGGRS
jgi:hypothetical protein